MFAAVDARKWVMRLLPWVITLGVLAYIGSTTDIDAALDTLKGTNWLGFVPTVLIVVLASFFFDSWALVQLFSRFNTPVTTREMLPLKGTSYFLNVINYNAAAAGIALFFRNRKDVPFLEALASMLWMNFIDIVSLATLMLVGMAFAAGSGGLDPDYQNILIGLAGFIYTVLAGSCIYWNYGFDWLILGRFRSWTIFSTFAKAKLSDYVRFIAIRTAFVMTYVVSQWACMPFFSMDATLGELLLYVPVLTFVGTIPLTTVAGMGTVQVLMRQFFLPFVPVAAASEMTAHIDAYSTTTILSFVLCRIIIGAFFMGSVTRDFEAHSASSSASESDKNSAP
ncbi:MAG: hypothetical protein ACI9WU_001868 [Myxococcota bacterium]